LRPEGGVPASCRIDKWLWHARLAKTRSLAARLCEEGAVTLGGHRAAKPHQPVHVGDIVTVPRGRFLLTLRVLAFGQRRGPASEARLLYEEAQPPEPLEVPELWEPLLADEEAGSA
jgi:ribosome-associated heat shock protein Hsp15